ncbi:class I SAM-dependent methyltransferase [Streptomyces sp. NBC_01260]|uniref:class I SAM-dependent DNA methyltransferase n=1 Tax=unclassified Streptomyces TaxID=2593676 RepID=UPI000F47F55D|nr:MULTISPECIES: class I SAM-dependent methyltransferase [unclassified Streptomyces]MCX4771454.1 class I SAM-dependent methyltransferase [Streptomyces sp. NBC_01285]ROQ81202.1 ubiquinone/menaquinone biosynthesis C-methylase UbiE [Streptomyces sp. CEV 2-1]
MTSDPTTQDRRPHYAVEFADDYDRWFGKPGVSGATVDALEGLAGEGPVLELGIGTGRIALPLRARGLDVHGIDASEAMVGRLRAKPGGVDLPVTIGDFSRVPVPDRDVFSLVYLAAGTFFELREQADQARCFAQVAQHLAPGGVFVFDSHVPEALAVAATGSQVVSEGDDHLVLCYRRIDPSVQRYSSHYVIHENDRTRQMRVEFRYAGAGELDLMARQAGLRLKERWGSWAGAPFTRDSTYHVSVYESR